ncbi:pyrimidine dimer DNA glycosylase/endonuclease V [Candidatus Woesearchaeota archaeon]|nr:pyrimidine dimer DNA glycosylase/endonuclease V [Candidatus Woesearchaeota archaeon]
MVRVNIINPRCLTDQHLVAEYLEILMLVSYVKKHPDTGEIPKDYRLGKGHILFFKNKLLYLKKRHERLKKEMKRRGFKATKTVSLRGCKKSFMKGWRPSKKDKEIIKKRLIARIRRKPSYFKYFRKKRTKEFLVNLVKKG